MCSVRRLHVHVDHIDNHVLSGLNFIVKIINRADQLITVSECFPQSIKTEIFVSGVSGCRPFFVTGEILSEIQ